MECVSLERIAMSVTVLDVFIELAPRLFQKDLEVPKLKCQHRKERIDQDE